MTDWSERFDAALAKCRRIEEQASPRPWKRGKRQDSIADIVNEEPQWGFGADGDAVGMLIAWFMGSDLDRDLREANAQLAILGPLTGDAMEALWRRRPTPLDLPWWWQQPGQAILRAFITHMEGLDG